MSASSNRCHILIVEDHIGMRRIIERRCAEFSTTVVSCGRMDEALAASRSFDPDWIIMDFNAKQGTGADGLAKLRALRPHARIIIVSQFVDEDFAQQARDSGAVAMVDKDDLSQLNRIIHNAPPRFPS